MNAIHGGSAVQGGYYLSKSNWEVFPIARDGERLPGPASEHYVKIPTAAAFVVVPALGGLMVLFLPFIGLYMTVTAAAAKVAGMFRGSAQDLAATVTPGWAPGAAHLTGKAAEKKEGEAAEGEAALGELSKEIEEKRKA
jgi:hypothetical protein